jgi:hypothetical protein
LESTRRHGGDPRGWLDACSARLGGHARRPSARRRETLRRRGLAACVPRRLFASSRRPPVREVAGGSTPSTPFVQPQRLMAAGRCSGRGAALGAARSPADMGPFALLCRNVRCQPAEDHQALDVAHGVPPPRAAPPVLRRVVLSDTRCPSGVPVSWSYSCGGARVRASALPAVVRCSSQEYKNLGQPRQKTQMIVASSLPFLLLFILFPSQLSSSPHPAFSSPTPVIFVSPHLSLTLALHVPTTSSPHRPPLFHCVKPCHPPSSP